MSSNEDTNKLIYILDGLRGSKNNFVAIFIFICINFLIKNWIKNYIHSHKSYFSLIGKFFIILNNFGIWFEWMLHFMFIYCLFIYSFIHSFIYGLLCF